MTYRDDREALHHRVAQLEEELEQTRREGVEKSRDEAHTRAAELEERVGKMRGELERMEAELQAMRGAKPPTTRGPRPRIALFMLGAGAAVIMTAIVMSSRPARRSYIQVPVSPVPTALTIPTVPQVPSSALPTIETVAPPTAPTALSPPRMTGARWSATVTRAEGLALQPGSTCTVDAMISATDTNAKVPMLAIACGTQKLYRSTDAFSGMSQSKNDARELLGASDDKSTFTLAYQDLGTRTGERAQIDLDTNAHQGSVFRETIPRFRVDLAIASATSAPTAPLTGADQRLRRTGKVMQADGPTAPKVGASCVLRAMANGKGSDCIAEVKCGTATLWSPTSTAPVTCTYDGPRALTVSAEGLVLDSGVLQVKTKGTSTTVTLDDAT